MTPAYESRCVSAALASEWRVNVAAVCHTKDFVFLKSGKIHDAPGNSSFFLVGSPQPAGLAKVRPRHLADSCLAAAMPRCLPQRQIWEDHHLLSSTPFVLQAFATTCVADNDCGLTLPLCCVWLRRRASWVTCLIMVASPKTEETKIHRPDG